MASLSIHDIGLRPTIMRALERKARRAGKSPAEYVRSIIEQDLLSTCAFNDILYPLRISVGRSLTPNRLDGIVQRGRTMAWKARRNSRG